MILIYGDAGQWDAMSEEQWKAHNTGHAAFVDEAGARVHDGRQLETAPGGHVVARGRERPGPHHRRPVPGDRGRLGGYYLLDAADLDEVLEPAGLLSELNHTHSALEIRPVVEHG
ncbi:Uncharacterized conserved protein [Lentzea albida]|uniref:Uncharacterized conserved protein n=2 Tax=Lentzea albida TaxID=65499 RepID=A0A1H9WGU0_9PSEU|nr:Uncharacterized conserved protein [Lentzea albida]